jgi:hypothetical protein
MTVTLNKVHVPKKDVESCGGIVTGCSVTVCIVFGVTTIKHLYDLWIPSYPFCESCQQFYVEQMQDLFIKSRHWINME